MTLTHSGPQAGPLQAARLTLDRACEHLAGLQHEPGWWQGELETNVTMDAEDLMLRQFLGIRSEADTAAAARWIRSSQRADGTWANFHDGPGDLSTTVEAYVALRLAGDAPDEPHMDTRPAGSAPRAGSRPPGCSPGSGWRCSGSGPGTICRSSRRS